MVSTHQSQTGEEDHDDDGRLEILVLDEPESLESEHGPALPERRLVVALQDGHLFVPVVRETGVGILRIFVSVSPRWNLDHHFLSFSFFFFSFANVFRTGSRLSFFLLFFSVASFQTLDVV